MDSVIYQLHHPWHWLTYGQNATALAAVAAVVGLIGTLFLHALHPSNDDAPRTDEQGQHYPRFNIARRSSVRSYKREACGGERDRANGSDYRRICGGSRCQEHWGGGCSLLECVVSAGERSLQRQ